MMHARSSTGSPASAEERTAAMRETSQGRVRPPARQTAAEANRAEAQRGASRYRTATVGLRTATELCQRRRFNRHSDADGAHGRNARAASSTDQHRARATTPAEGGRGKPCCSSASNQDDVNDRAVIHVACVSVVRAG